MKNFSRRTRELALARARFKCERCGTFEKLTLHHIFGRISSALDNAMVLCERCHYWKHHTKRRHHK